MPSKRKFHKATVTIEILSEEPLPDELELDEIKHLITDGPCSGRLHHSVKELMAEEAAKELIEQGSDPSFFNLDEQGNDAEEV